VRKKTGLASGDVQVAASDVLMKASPAIMLREDAEYCDICAAMVQGLTPPKRSRNALMQYKNV
jgi:hypothetical protein